MYSTWPVSPNPIKIFPRSCKNSDFLMLIYKNLAKCSMEGVQEMEETAITEVDNSVDKQPMLGEGNKSDPADGRVLY